MSNVGFTGFYYDHIYQNLFNKDIEIRRLAAQLFVNKSVITVPPKRLLEDVIRYHFKYEVILFSITIKRYTHNRSLLYRLEAQITGKRLSMLSNSLTTFSILWRSFKCSIYILIENKKLMLAMWLWQFAMWSIIRSRNGTLKVNFWQHMKMANSKIVQKKI